MEQDKPDLNAFAERLGTAGDPSGSAPAATDPGAVDEVGPWRALRRAPVRRAAAALLGSLALLLLGGVVRRRLAAA
ncbi:MAG: hypothetical protein M3Q71_14120 [Chloroflexota bacterium]|nr:hypothetical protein [Chloroflexota bacterium]